MWKDVAYFELWLENQNNVILVHFYWHFWMRKCDPTTQNNKVDVCKQLTNWIHARIPSEMGANTYSSESVHTGYIDNVAFSCN